MARATPLVTEEKMKRDFREKFPLLAATTMTEPTTWMSATMMAERC